MTQPLIIVADQVFVIAERINHIYLEETQDSESRDILYPGFWGWFGRKLRVRTTFSTFNIRINYVQVNSQRGEASMEVTVLDKKEAFALYQAIVKQYRDQNPDHIYLAKAMDDFLG